VPKLFYRRHFRRSNGYAGEPRGTGATLLPVFVPEGETQASWRWLGKLLPSTRWSNLDELLAMLDQALPGVLSAAPSEDFRVSGRPIARQTYGASGRTAMSANINVHEPPPPDDPDTPLTFSMEGSPEQPPSSLLSRYWKPGWNSVQALNKSQQEVGGPLRGDSVGVKLIQPTGTAGYYAGIPQASARQEKEDNQ